MQFLVALLCALAILLLAIVAMRINATAAAEAAVPTVTAAAPTATPHQSAAPTASPQGKAVLRGETVSVDKSAARLLAQMAWGEARGCSDMEIAATMWCVCNRCDAWGLSVAEAVTAPGQFCGYCSGNPVTDKLYTLAVDVLTRWELEHAGQTEVGRVLPAAYLWFTGDGSHNSFRDSFRGGHVWDWSLPDVYGED